MSPDPKKNTEAICIPVVIIMVFIFELTTYLCLGVSIVEYMYTV